MQGDNISPTGCCQIGAPETKFDNAFSPLISFVLRGLRNCWLPDNQWWSHAYHLDGRPQPNQSIPASDIFYSLNVLLGLSRTPHSAVLGYDVDGILDRCSRKLLELPVNKYAYGMAVWTAASFKRELPQVASEAIFAFAHHKRNWETFSAQDLGLILTGFSAQSSAADDRYRGLTASLFEFLKERFSAPSGLFYEGAAGWRRNFSSFAAQTYLTLACYNYFEVSRDERALDLANRCVRKLIELQGPQGEWPWFYHVPTGKVLDFYEVYSVHQDGMAPAFLEHAELHGIPGARDALTRGFEWILGKNQLRQSMLRPDEGMIIRSQLRKGELYSKWPRLLRSTFHSLANTSQGLAEPSGVTLRLECRSYHLGWILWSFAGRTDIPEITHAKAFVH